MGSALIGNYKVLCFSSNEKKLHLLDVHVVYRKDYYNSFSGLSA